MVSCGVPVAQQKLFGLPSNDSVLLSRLNLVDGQQFLLYRTKRESSSSSSSLDGRSLSAKGESESIWEELPGEVKYLVFGLLEPWTLLMCSLVCRNWNEISRDNWIWEEKVHNRWSVLREVSPVGSVSWRSFYFEQHRLQTNWTRNKYKVQRLNILALTCLDYKQHGYQVMCETSAAPPEAENDSEFARMQTQYNEDRADSIFVAASSQRYQIYVGNLWNAEAKKTLLGHNAHIHAVAFAGLHHLLSSDASGAIFLWDLHRSRASLPWSLTSSEFVGKRQIHNRPIVALHMSQGRILAGAADGTVAVLDLNRAVHPMMIARKNHADTVSCLDDLPTSNLFASAGKEGFAKVWDMRSASPVMTLYADAEELCQVKFGWPHQLLTSGASGVRMWDLRTASVLFEPMDERTTALEYDGTRILMAGDTRAYYSQLGPLGVPPVDFSLDLHPNNNRSNKNNVNDDAAMGVVELIQTYQLPLANTTRAFMSPSTLVTLSSGEVIGFDVSARVPRTRHKPDTMFQDLDEYIPPTAMDADEDE